MKTHKHFLFLLTAHPILLLLLTTPAAAQTLDTLGLAWSKTSVNAVIFRKNSVTSFGDNHYTAYYDTAGNIVLGVQRGSGPWQIRSTALKGRVADAHNSISMIADGEGYLHLAWDHHNNQLNYCRSKGPGSLELSGSTTMTGKDEERVTYPEFYRMPDGGLIFFYRSGESGRGNLIMNRYDITSKKWQRAQENLIDGENERNAYWQAHVSKQGTIHISWVWREEPDVATNHDLCYARSRDGGITWERSTGEKYVLPIRANNAEYAMMIPQQSELINQTSMTATPDDHPVIATYWRQQNSKAPQFYVVRHDEKGWLLEQVSQRTEPFSLKGAGTKKIPVSRPLILSKDMVVYRDNERGHMVTIARREKKGWTYTDMVPISDSSWEPTGDNTAGGLKLFLQDVGQGDGEKLADKRPTPVVIMTIR